LLDGMFMGLAFKLVLGASSAENAGATWRWSWSTAGHGVLGGVCSGLAFGCVYVGAKTSTVELSVPAGALVDGVTSALAFGAINGWQPDFSQPPMRPGQALRRTLRTYGRWITGSLVIAVILCAVLFTVAQALFPSAHHQSFTDSIQAVIVTSLSALVLCVVCKGLLPWIDHRVARLVAAWADLLPRDLVAFLDHSDDRVLLRRSGGYYLFLHRTLRDHLATCDPQRHPFPIASVPDPQR
jgi:hypothetical protein